MNTRTVLEPMITAIRRVPSTGWILSVHYPKNVAQSPFLTARRDLVLVVALGAAVLLGVVLFWSRRMVQPLSANVSASYCQFLRCGSVQGETQHTQVSPQKFFFAAVSPLIQ